MVIEQEIEISKIEELKRLLETEPKKIVVISHTNPDGDAIGSSLAWAQALRSYGHQVLCVVPNKYPYFLEWMPGISELGIFKNDTDGKLATAIAEAHIFFCLDFNRIDRLEKMSAAIEANKKAEFILIDHHLDPPHDFLIEFSYPSISSTSYIVYKLIVALKGKEFISKDLAEELYVGMMTDTGNFSFSNLTPALFRTVADLIEAGLDIPYVNSSVYNSFTADRVRLLGFALSKMETIDVNDNRIAYIGLKENELRRFRFQPGDSEGFVNYPLSIFGMSMSAMFLETRHFIRVSLRSKGDVDVSRFAALYFEGGGHKNAAGGKSYRNMEETARYFRTCAEEYFTLVDKGMLSGE